MSSLRARSATLAMVLLAACASGPDYRRPDLVLPESWPVQPDAAARKASSTGEQWWQLYADSTLDQLEEEALAHNADLQLAAARIVEARAQLGITEADQYPSVTAHATGSRTQNTLAGAFPRPPTLPRTQNLSHVSLDASYELDLWGKFRRATEAARADLLSTEWARETVRLTLAAQVAQQYFALIALDGQEQAIRRLLASREERLALNRKQQAAGVLSEFDVHQAEADVAAVQSQLASAVQARNRQETALALLLGRAPREVMGSALQRGNPASPTVTVPEGLPAELLLRRPDLQSAEQQLVALNARIGVARAQYFPSIALTSYLGSESVAFSDLFTSPARIFQFAANISQPIFSAGRVGNQVGVAEARREQALIQYKQTVANAFGDVRNALSAQDAARQVLDAESRRSDALELAYKQADLRYQNGIASRLELLDVERNYLQAQLNRIDAERAQRSAVADLFKAMGGGWGTKEGAR